MQSSEYENTKVEVHAYVNSLRWLKRQRFLLLGASDESAVVRLFSLLPVFIMMPLVVGAITEGMFGNYAFIFIGAALVLDMGLFVAGDITECCGCETEKGGVP